MDLLGLKVEGVHDSAFSPRAEGHAFNGSSNTPDRVARFFVLIELHMMVSPRATDGTSLLFGRVQI